MSDFDTSLENNGSFSVWGWISLFYIAQICNFIIRNVTIPVGTGVVGSVLVSAGNEITQICSSTIYNDPSLETYRTDGSSMASGRLEDLFVGGEKEFWQLFLTAA